MGKPGAVDFKKLGNKSSTLTDDTLLKSSNIFKDKTDLLKLNINSKAMLLSSTGNDCDTPTKTTTPNKNTFLKSLSCKPVNPDIVDKKSLQKTKTIQPSPKKRLSNIEEVDNMQESELFENDDSFETSEFSEIFDENVYKEDFFKQNIKVPFSVNKKTEWPHTKTWNASKILYKSR